MDDNFRHFLDSKLKRELATRKENLTVGLEQIRYRLAHEIQTRKEWLVRSEREAGELHKERMADREADNSRKVERIKGTNAESLEILRANLGLQTRIIGERLDEIDHGRKLAEIHHNALADSFRAGANAIAQTYTDRKRSEREHAQAMEIKRLDLENDLLRAQIGHANVLELEEKRLDCDLIRTQIAHENAVGLETARHQHEIFLTVIQSHLRNEEITHAEIVRLVIRMMEGASAKASERDTQKWASECCDEWERERTGRV